MTTRSKPSRPNRLSRLSQYGEIFGIKIIDDSDADLQRQDPPRTRARYPYSYDPFTIWGDPHPNDRCNGSDYTDRLEEWDYKKFNELAKEIYVDGDQRAAPFNSFNCRGDLIQKFLRRYHDAPDLELLRVIEYCNVSTGYPTWRLDYVIPSRPANS